VVVVVGLFYVDDRVIVALVEVFGRWRLVVGIVLVGDALEAARLPRASQIDALAADLPHQ
jgi:hypothetical protein